MKLFVLALSLLTSVPTFAGDMYLSCGLGKEEHWENFTDSVLDNGKGMVVVENGKFTYVITVENKLYRVIKTNRNIGGFEEIKDITASDESAFNEANLVDDVWCHIND